MHLIDSDLYNKILIEPSFDDAQLCIITGYATYGMVHRHMQDLEKQRKQKYNIKLIVGMTAKDGIRKSDHIGFSDTASNSINFCCSYIPDWKASVHGKAYVWCSSTGDPISAFVGSANYTQTAFLLPEKQREIMTPADPESVFTYYGKIEKDAINCLSSDIEGLVMEDPKRNVAEAIRRVKNRKSNIKPDQITLSLLTKNEDVGHGSGINWGHRKDGTKREPNQAYIPIPAEVRVQHPTFFPERGVQFTLLTEDNKPMLGVIAQDGGKGLHSSQNNSELGKYIRAKMGLPDGKFITKEDLLKYGRTNITITKIDDESYCLDFSPASSITEGNPI